MLAAEEVVARGAHGDSAEKELPVIGRSEERPSRSLVTYLDLY